MKFVKVGRLNKAFGTKGYIKVIAEKAYEQDLLSSDVWFVDFRGDTIPYFVEEAKIDSNFLVKFEDVDSPERTVSISGSSLYLKPKDISHTETEEDFMSKLIGFMVVNQSNIEIGEIQRLEEFPQQTMAFLDFDDKEIMIPLHQNLITDIDVKQMRIYLDIPEGLIESQK